ncbi:MAG: hypothetical protein AAGG02_15520 [Cyanobacteria bacterium P01_H01_bin.15]
MFRNIKLLPAVVIASLGFGTTAATAAVTTIGCADPTFCTFTEFFIDGAIIETDTLAFFGLASDFENDPIITGFDPDNVFISGLHDQPLNDGLLFDFNGEYFNSFPPFPPDTVLGVAFLYGVVALEGGPINHVATEITDLTLTGQSSDLVIAKSVTDTNSDELLASQVVGESENGDSQLASKNFFPNQPAVLVTDAISSDVEVPGDSVNLETFEQRFSQTPEPFSFLTLLLGVASLGGGSVVSRSLKRKS